MADLIRFNVGLKNSKSELYKYIDKNRDELKGNLGAEVARLAELGLIFSRLGGLPTEFTGVIPSNELASIHNEENVKISSEVKESDFVDDVSDTEEFHDVLSASLFG